MNITRNSINSSGKPFGTVTITNDQLLIRHDLKPELIIKDPDVIQEVLNKTDKGIKILYDNYYLGIGEIAALYEVCYANLNRRIKKIEITTGKNDKRRSTTYGRKLSEETRRKIGEKSKGRKGSGRYERTPEIREKISKGLKEYYATHEVSEETRKKLSQAWADGKYDNSPMGTGIHGYFYSIKNNRKFYYRSLLELYYLLKIEEDSSIYAFQVEPFQISLDGIHHYTPDFLINDQHIKELKPANHLNYIKEQERFELEVKSAQEYANNHNMTFEVIYDTDLGYDTRQFKRWLLNHSEIIDLYQITFDRDISNWS